MNKIIITRMDGQILTALMNGKRAAQLNLEEEETSILGNIYIGKVKNIAKNISSAFVDLGGGQMAYYSLTENKRHLFTNQDSSCRPLRPGDDIVVQVSKDAIKTKDPVVTGCISFTGRYCVLTTGRPRLGFSSKITDGSWKAQARQVLSEEKDEELGIIVRTNAQSVPVEELLTELGQLKDQYYKLMAQVAYRTSGTLLYEAPPSYICSLRDTYQEAMEEIVTDEEDIFCRIQEYLKIHQPQDLFRARFYQDPLLSLKNLYSLDKAMEDALAKRVWLRSGGYLVIDRHRRKQRKVRRQKDAAGDHTQDQSGGCRGNRPPAAAAQPFRHYPYRLYRYGVSGTPKGTDGSFGLLLRKRPGADHGGGHDQAGTGGSDQKKSTKAIMGTDTKRR